VKLFIQECWKVISTWNILMADFCGRESVWGIESAWEDNIVWLDLRKISSFIWFLP